MGTFAPRGKFTGFRGNLARSLRGVTNRTAWAHSAPAGVPGGWTTWARGRTFQDVRLSREELDRQVDRLVDACRVECLWSLRPDYYPRSDEERLRVLEAIQRHAGLEAWREAARLKRWLSALSSATSAGS